MSVSLPVELTLLSNSFPADDGTVSLNIPGIPPVSVTLFCKINYFLSDNFFSIS